MCAGQPGLLAAGQAVQTVLATRQLRAAGTGAGTQGVTLGSHVIMAHRGLTHLPSIDLSDNLTADSGAGLGELPLYLARGVPRISKQVTDKLEAEM